MVDSVCEAEYIAASDAAKEAVWLRKFLGELGVVPALESPILVYCDSTRVIVQAKEPKLHHQTKHVLRRYHLVREIVERGCCPGGYPRGGWIGSFVEFNLSWDPTVVAYVFSDLR